MKKSLLVVAVIGAFGFCVHANDSTASSTNTMPPFSTNSMSSMSDGLANNYAGRLGVGVIAGEPAGFSVKYWLNDTLAIDGAAGWSFRDNTDFYLHSDVLWHDFNLIPVSRGQLPVYFGIGALARFRDSHHDNEVGIRGPIGLSYMFDTAPVDIFAEVAPGFDLAPDVRVDITGDVGVRYWF